MDQGKISKKQEEREELKGDKQRGKKTSGSEDLWKSSGAEKKQGFSER